MRQIRKYANELFKRIKSDHAHKDANLLKTLDKLKKAWTIKEKAKFIEIVGKYGKDYGMLARNIKTKTRK